MMKRCATRLLASPTPHPPASTQHATTPPTTPSPVAAAAATTTTSVSAPPPTYPTLSPTPLGPDAPGDEAADAVSHFISRHRAALRARRVSVLAARRRYLEAIVDGTPLPSSAPPTDLPPAALATKRGAVADELVRLIDSLHAEGCAVGAEAYAAVVAFVGADCRRFDLAFSLLGEMETVHCLPVTEACIVGLAHAASAASEENRRGSRTLHGRLWAYAEARGVVLGAAAIDAVLYGGGDTSLAPPPDVLLTLYCGWCAAEKGWLAAGATADDAAAVLAFVQNDAQLHYFLAWLRDGPHAELLENRLVLRNALAAAGRAGDAVLAEEIFEGKFGGGGGGGGTRTCGVYTAYLAALSGAAPARFPQALRLIAADRDVRLDENSVRHWRRLAHARRDVLGGYEVACPENPEGLAMVELINAAAYGRSGDARRRREAPFEAHPDPRRTPYLNELPSHVDEGMPWRHEHLRPPHVWAAVTPVVPTGREGDLGARTVSGRAYPRLSVEY